MVIVVQALIRIGRRVLHGILGPAMAVAGFIALFVFNVPFPVVVLGAGVVGYISTRKLASDAVEAALTECQEGEIVRPGTRRAACIFVLLWGLTVGALLLVLGGDSVFSKLRFSFRKWQR